MRRKSRIRHSRVPTDHVDAWLMSYADLITLLFMLFVVFVSITLTKRDHTSPRFGEPEHPYVEQHSGLLALGTHYDELYRRLTGIVATAQADQAIAIEKTEHGISIDIATEFLFAPGSAEMRSRPEVIDSIMKALAQPMLNDTVIEVEAYSDDDAPAGNGFANNWELCAMRSARLVTLLTNQGIDSARLRAVSHAGNAPVVPNQDAAGRPIVENKIRNQRIVINVGKAPGR